MRLRKYYLNEKIQTHDLVNDEEGGHYDDIAKQIKKDCKPWLKEGRNLPGWRGTHKTYNNPYILRLKTRTTRRPLSSDPILHKIADDAFLDIFGWRSRSQVLFVQGNSSIGPYYGTNIWAVFPIGPIKYVYSQTFMDFLNVLTRIRLNKTDLYNMDELATNKEAQEIFKTEIRKIVKDKYQDSYLSSTLERQSPHEIMVKCKEYYIVPKWLYEQHLEDRLLK